MKANTINLPYISSNTWALLHSICMNFILVALILLTLFPNYSYSSNQDIRSTDALTLTVVRGMGDYPPLEMTLNEQLTGLHIDMIRAVSRQLNIQVEFVSRPWVRAIHEFSEGKYDAITYFGYTAEREKFSYFYKNNILSNTHWVFLALKEREHEFNIKKDLSGLENLVIGVQNGYSHGKFFDSMDNITRDVVMSEFDLEFMLRKWRHDLVMMSFQEYLGFKKRGDFKGIVPLSPMIDMDPQYIAFSKIKKDNNLSNISQQFSEQFKIFKDSEQYHRLLEKYNFLHYK